MQSTVRGISTLFAALLFGCSASPVPVGTNLGATGDGGSSGGNSSSGGSSGGNSSSGSSGPCASAPVPTIACATGPTVQTCDTGTTPPSWQLTCMGSGSSQPSMPVNPCGDLPVETIGCASGQPLYTCDAAGAAPHWTVSCPGETIGNLSPSHPEQPVDSGATACANLPVDTIGCATGEPTYACELDSGAPHWVVVCP